MIDTSSEAWRHQCEVRYVLRLTVKSPRKATEYMNLVEDKSQRHQQLKRDCRQQWERGNRGEQGDWK